MRADPVWAIIPALNVENSIGEVIDQTKEYIPRVIIVNNGAIDSIELTTCHFQTETVALLWAAPRRTTWWSQTVTGQPPYVLTPEGRRPPNSPKKVLRAGTQ